MRGDDVLDDKLEATLGNASALSAFATQTMKNELTNPKLQYMWKQARWIVTCEYVSGKHYYLSKCLTVCTVLVSFLFLFASLPLSLPLFVSPPLSLQTDTGQLEHVKWKQG